MISVKKFVNGATSSAGAESKRGGKGSLELEAKLVEADGKRSYNIVFSDYGNYGRKRWSADFGQLSDSDVQAIIKRLEALRASDS
tara:strand:+ start:750 stop:1004 length:255 start_codon:yes stop_codon:yes gene_type:complete